MEIILKGDILGLGYKNDIVNVKSGYGRNYLIPQGKGVIASVSAKKILAENLKQQAHKLAALKAEAEKKAEALKDVELEIVAKVSATGVTYGSVNVSSVVEALKAKGIDVFANLVCYFAIAHFYVAMSVSINININRFGNTNGIRELNKHFVSYTGSDEILCDMTSCISGTTIDLTRIF